MIGKKIKILISMFCCITYVINGAQPPGLANFGATCYLNATIQNLFNYTPLNNLLVSGGRPRINYPAGGFANSYVQLIIELQKGKSLSEEHPALVDFVNKHAYRVMNGCGQQDATEFIAQVLNRLMEEDPNFQEQKYRNDPNILKRDHPIGKLINFGQASIVTCPDIAFQRTRVDYELIINPEVGKLTTVKACLQNFFATEQLNDPNNLYRLDLKEAEIENRPELLPYNKTGIPNCNRKLALDHTNDLVIIALKRYEQDMYGTRTKLNQDILVDQVLNFGPYMAKAEMRTNQPNYNLIGAIIQIGELGGGHYVAFVKSNGTWYFCNDTKVEPTTWNAMELGTYSIHQSYMLFYQRQGGLTPITPPTSQPGPQKSSTAKTTTLKDALTKLQVALDGLNAALSSR